MKLTPEQRETIVKEYMRGETAFPVAQRHGISETTVCRLARESGYVRGRGPRKNKGGTR